jgi:hypothetical protein
VHSWGAYVREAPTCVVWAKQPALGSTADRGLCLDNAADL